MIVADVQDQVPPQRWARLRTQDVDIADEASEPVPDLVVLARDLLPQGGTAAAVSAGHDGRGSRLRIKRPPGLRGQTVDLRGGGGIPAHLVIDPVMAQCVLLTKPEGQGEDADYRSREIVKFGDRVPLEAPGIELDTGDFGTFHGVRAHRCP